MFWPAARATTRSSAASAMTRCAAGWATIRSTAGPAPTSSTAGRATTPSTPSTERPTSFSPAPPPTTALSTASATTTISKAVRSRRGTSRSSPDRASRGCPDSFFAVESRANELDKVNDRTELKRLHRARADISYNRMARTAQSLVSAAAIQFGSYRKAVELAGIDYTSVLRRPRWTRQAHSSSSSSRPAAAARI